MSRIIILLAIIAIVVFFGPWATITALNTLFGLNIPITVTTWLSMAWLHAIFVMRASK